MDLLLSFVGFVLFCVCAVFVFPRLIPVAKHCSRAAAAFLPLDRISIRTLSIIAAVGVLGGVLVMKSLDTPRSNDLLKDQDRAVRLARAYANDIVDSDIEALRKKALSGSAAAEKLSSSPPPDWRGISGSVYQTKYGPETEYGTRAHPLMDPVRASFAPRDSRMQLLRLRRQENFIVLTFAALADPAWGQFVRIDSRPLIVSVAIRYFLPVPGDQFGRWVLQLVNVDFLPDVIRARASGDWYLIDYRYSFNLREYYDWVRQNEQRLYAERAEQRRRDMSLKHSAPEEGLREIVEQSQKHLDDSYQWAEDECEAQQNELMTQGDVR